MNREIKFRAWSTGNKRMVEFDLNDLMYGTHSLDTVDLKYWIVTQYTGLKDKNGKEIYEGDVLALHDGQKWFIRNFIHDSYHLEYMLRTEKDETCEVIGNIYENPELLKHD